MVASFDNVYVRQTGAFLPSDPVSNAEMDRYIEPLNALSGRLKRRILAENGIVTRHYAIDSEGRTRYSATEMAARAIRACLERAGQGLDDVSLLCAGTSGADAAVPGFANMVQGALGAPPMETSSHHGVCAAGMTALQYACMAIETGRHERAVAVASEFPSRLFKKTRFAPQGHVADFDSHFLRWMLSDGAGAVLLSNHPQDLVPNLKVRWLHLKSFSGDYPVCMQAGFPAGSEAEKSYLDYPSFADAERAGAILLRQDVRLLPQLFDLAIHEYIKLVHDRWIHPSEIDYFLCHYSSEKFAATIDRLLQTAGLAIPKERWYSNLKTRGNTGAASIFIMLEEFVRTHSLKVGQKIFCFVPESGRFTVSYMLIEVVDPPKKEVSMITLPEPPHVAPAGDSSQLAQLLTELAVVWHDFRSKMFRTPFIQRIVQNHVTKEDYLRWMENWIPQVREGSHWMRMAAANLCAPYEGLRTAIEHHAGQEQFDFKILFEDYRNAGGAVSSLDALQRNPGGEALNAYMYHRARQPNAVDLLGAIYIIEGTGSRIIPTLLPLLRKQLPFSDRVFRFLRYHGENDESHLEEWREGVAHVLRVAPTDIRPQIIQTAKTTAALYLMQMEHVQ